jgi:hypothetical protein
MREVSDRFLAAIRGSHKMRARARVVTFFQEGTDPTGTEIPILGGDVKLSATSDIRATLELLTDGNGWDPSTSDITPYGNEIYVERGIEYGDGAVEWVGLGYFRIYDVDQDDVPNGPLRISGRDRTSAIIDAKLERPYAPNTDDDGGYDSTIAISTVLHYLINGSDDSPWSGMTVSSDDNWDDDNVVAGLVIEEDRYGFIKDLARSYGKEVFVNYDGALRFEVTPDPSVPLWTVDAGEQGVLIAMSRKLTREGIYNSIVTTGEAIDDNNAAVRAVVRDSNPDSRTSVHGSFGKVPRFYRSESLTVDTKAVDAGRALLRQSLGRPVAADFSAVPNPALEPFDPIRIRYPTGSNVHVIDDLTIPLTADQPMTGAVRAVIQEAFEVG